ncbi:MAG: hypothetical protein WC716_07420 [Chitinophagaceae bacterium]|jgi:tetratricopeptide (TPR) repeat protein
MQLKTIICAFILCCSSAAYAYDKVFVARCLEEQSYSTLLDIAGQINENEYDNFLLNALGYAAFQSSLYEKSASFYHKSFDKDTNNIQANLYIGLIKKQQKKFDEGLPYFQRLIGLKPGQPRFYKLAGDCFSATRRTDSAIVYLGNAFQLANNDLGIAHQYAELLYERKYFTEVDRVVQTVMTVDSNNPSILGIAIRSAYQQKKYKEVLPLATKVQALNLGESAYASLMFGVFASLQLKDYQQSLTFSTYLMESGSESEQVYYYAAKAYAGMKSYAQSNELLKKCLELAISKQAEQYYIEMADNEEHLNNYTKAQRHYDTARYMFGSNVVLYRKALAYDAAKQGDKAKKAYLDFLKFAKDEDTALQNFAKKRAENL